MTVTEMTYRYETTTKPLTADETHQALLERGQDYEPYTTEAHLGIVYTEPRQVRMPGRHNLWVLDESVQDTGNYKYNGMAEKVRRLRLDQPDVERVYIGSAGNAGAALVAAASRQGLFVQVETPSSLVPRKRSLLESPSSKVNAVHDSVESATAAAMAAAEDDPFGAFVHAYNDLDAISGQGFVAKRALAGLQRLHASGRLDLQNDTVRLLVQRGGGSLLTGFASELRRLKDGGAIGENVQLFQVRPESSHEKYDGLNVQAPGSYAQTMLDDPRFIAGSIYINDVNTGEAARDMAQAFSGKRFEPSGLAGVAGFKRLQSGVEPVTYVTVLTGANYSPEGYEYFRDAPRRQQYDLLHVELPSRRVPLSKPDPEKAITSRWLMEPKYYGRMALKAE